MSPEEGNYGSTMFDDHHRESFVDESPNPPTDAQLASAQHDEVIEDIHDDQEALQGVEIPDVVEEEKELVEEQKGASPADLPNDNQEHQRSPGAGQSEAEQESPELSPQIQQQSPAGAQEDDEQEDDEEDDNPPLLFVDVNLGASEQQRIVVYEGDTAPDLAAKFCAEHELDDET